MGLNGPESLPFDGTAVARPVDPRTPWYCSVLCSWASIVCTAGLLAGRMGAEWWWFAARGHMLSSGSHPAPA